jgi:hypothetical protein
LRSLLNAISFLLGVDTRASVFALSQFLSGFINGPAGLLSGLAFVVSRSGGVTVPTATVGFTVLDDGENCRMIDIRKKL